MQMPSLKQRLVSTVGVAALCFASGSVAQATGLGWLPTEWEAGGMVLTTPKYEGARNQRIIGVPLLFPSGTDSNGRIQFKGPEDVRLRLLSAYGFHAGPVAGWRFGRDESDGRLLRGMGDVDGGLVLGGYAAYTAGILTAFASYGHQATGDDTGGVLRFGLEAQVINTRSLSLTLLGGASWADDDYMSAFFGVSPGQAARSGLAAYRAEAGIKDVHVGFSASMPIAERWSLRLLGRYSHLVGDAVDSPVVEREGQWTGGIGLTYRFSLPR
jgi:outer membrane protein